MKALAEQISDIDGINIYGRVVGVRGLMVEIAGPIHAMSVGARIIIETGGNRFIPSEVIGFTGNKKLLQRNILGRFVKNCIIRPCETESDFVNHVPSGSESVVQRRFECRKCGRPDARSGDYRGLACAFC